MPTAAIQTIIFPSNGNDNKADKNIQNKKVIPTANGNNNE